MPLVQIKLIEGVMTDEEKQQMINKVTEAMVSIEGENLREYTLVIIDEVKSGDWAIGGKPLKAEDVKTVMAKGRNKAA